MSMGWRPRMDFQPSEGPGRVRYPYVSLTIYGDGDNAPAGSEPAEERLGAAMGALFRVAEAAWAVDPYGTPLWRQHRASYDYRGIKRVYDYHCLDFIVSSDDVTAGGPIHRERAKACSQAMRKALSESTGRIF